MSETSLEKLEIGDILSAGFAPLKAQFWKLLVWVGIPYFLLSVVLIGGVVSIFFWKFMPFFTMIFSEKNVKLAEFQPLAWAYVGILLVAFIPSSMASAALFRFHTGAGLKGWFFAFRFGADEIRQYVILWAMIIMTTVLPTAIVIAVIGVANTMHSDALVLGLVLLAVFLLPLVMIFLGVRFSLVFAHTFADRRLRVFGSWQRTRGHFWVLFLTFSVLVVLFGLVSMLISAPANFIFYTQPSTGWLGDPEILKSLDPEDVQVLLRETFFGTRTIVAFSWALIAGSLVNIFQIAAFNGASLFVYQHGKEGRQA